MLQIGVEHAASLPLDRLGDRYVGSRGRGLAAWPNALRSCVRDTRNLDVHIETIEKLRFILNRRVETALAPRESILEAINRYYGQVEGESADSMLQEFTDTAIDFTET